MGDGDVSCQVFFMDTRAYSKGYEEYYRRAESKYGVKYTRCRLSDVKEDPQTGNLSVRYNAPYEGSQQVIEQEFDLVVLSVGMEISESVKDLGQQPGHRAGRVRILPHHPVRPAANQPGRASMSPGHSASPKTSPRRSSKPAAPPPARHACWRLPATPWHSRRNTPRNEISAMRSRASGCSSATAAAISAVTWTCRSVAEYARTLPGVVHAEDNLYTCSQDTIAHIIEQVKELDLNRVVVASCTPLTHEPLFQDAIRQAGINPHLFEMANIRNQCSWVHSNDWEGATLKAKSLVRMAVARAAKLEPLKVASVAVNNTALIIGGGAAGMTAALALADQGFPVHLVERQESLGGNLRHLRYFLPGSNGDQAATPQEYLAEIISQGG